MPPKKAPSESNKIKQNKAPNCRTCNEPLLDKPEKEEEQSIECECCDNFFHIGCVSVSDRKLKAILEFEVHWYCPSCELGAKKLKKLCISLQAEQTKMKSDIATIKKNATKLDTRLTTVESNLSQKIEDKFEELELKIANLKSPDGEFESEEGNTTTINEKINTLNEKVIELEDKLEENSKKAPGNNELATSQDIPSTDTIKSMINAHMQEKNKDEEEAKLREKKKMNLIFFNIPEEDGDSVIDKMKADFNKIKEAYEDKVELKEADIINVIRIGKKTFGKERPVILTFKSDDKRMEVLRKNKDIKYITEDGEIIRIFVSTDKTIKQRQTEAALREEIKNRVDAGEANLVIRNERIVPFRSGAQKSWAALFH